VLATLIPLALVIALSPITVIPAVLVLHAPRPRPASLAFLSGWLLGLALVSVIIILAFHAGVDLVMRVSPLYALTLPLGALILAYMLLRSTLVTLRQGGIIWRDTFYPLDELKRGAV